MSTVNLGRVRGCMWYVGDGVDGDSTTPTVFPDSGIAKAYVGDMYLHLAPNDSDNGHVYQCDLAGNASTAKWVYDGDITGPMPELEDSLTSSSTIKALTANGGKKLKDIIDNAGLYPKEIITNCEAIGYTASLIIENVSTNITFTDDQGNTGTYSYTKSGDNESVTLPISIDSTIGFTDAGAIIKKVASSAAGIKTCQITGESSVIFNESPSIWPHITDLEAEITPGATINEVDPSDPGETITYRTGLIRKKISGVLTNLFPQTHVKAVWKNKAANKTLDDFLGSTDISSIGSGTVTGAISTNAVAIGNNTESFGQVETTETAAYSHSIGETFIYMDQFVKATSEITGGTTTIIIKPAAGYNVEKTTVSDMLTELNSKTTREYVEYTPTTNETFSSALDHLYALIDENKLTAESLLYMVGGLIACTSQINIALLRYSATQISNGKLYCYEFLLKSSGSQWLTMDGSTYHDFSTEIVTTTLRLYY